MPAPHMHRCGCMCRDGCRAHHVDTGRTSRHATSGSAPAASRAATVAWWPSQAAMCSGATPAGMRARGGGSRRLAGRVARQPDSAASQRHRQQHTACLRCRLPWKCSLPSAPVHPAPRAAAAPTPEHGTQLGGRQARVFREEAAQRKGGGAVQLRNLLVWQRARCHQRRHQPGEGEGARVQRRWVTGRRAAVRQRVSAWSTMAASTVEPHLWQSVRAAACSAPKLLGPVRAASSAASPCSSSSLARAVWPASSSSSSAHSVGSRRVAARVSTMAAGAAASDGVGGLAWGAWPRDRFSVGLPCALRRQWGRSGAGSGVRRAAAWASEQRLGPGGAPCCEWACRRERLEA